MKAVLVAKEIVGIYLFLRTMYFWAGLVALAYAAKYGSLLLRRGKAKGEPSNGAAAKRE
jgi:hypothetical protein